MNKQNAIAKEMKKINIKKYDIYFILILEKWFLKRLKQNN